MFVEKTSQATAKLRRPSIYQPINQEHSVNFIICNYYTFYSFHATSFFRPSSLRSSTFQRISDVIRKEEQEEENIQDSTVNNDFNFHQIKTSSSPAYKP